jgi:hypothetical protein
LPSPKAPAFVSKWLIIAVAHFILLFLLVAILTYKECFTIVADVFSCLCNCGWPVAATSSGVYPWEHLERYLKGKVGRRKID